MVKRACAVLVLSAWVSAMAEAQDTTRLPIYRHYKETALTIGYNFNFGDEVNGVKQPALHFLELGFWRSNVALGHHPVMATYYGASDFALNTSDFVIGPKVGGFISILVFGFGGELTYYTDFVSGSLRFIPYFGYCTPFFKLTVNPHVVLTNREFQNLNSVHINLAIRILKVKRTGF